MKKREGEELAKTLSIEEPGSRKVEKLRSGEAGALRRRRVEELTAEKLKGCEVGEREGEKLGSNWLNSRERVPRVA